MKVQGIDAYTNQYTNETGEGSRAVVGRPAEKSRQAAVSKTGQMESNPENLVTSKEREFFIRLFPENSEQLSRHVLFNRNGKLQSANISKGQIVDGRV